MHWVDKVFWRLDGGTYLCAVLINEIPKLYLFCNLIGTVHLEEVSLHLKFFIRSHTSILHSSSSRSKPSSNHVSRQNHVHLSFPVRFRASKNLPRSAVPRHHFISGTGNPPLTQPHESSLQPLTLFSRGREKSLLHVVNPAGNVPEVCPLKENSGNKECELRRGP